MSAEHPDASTENEATLNELDAEFFADMERRGLGVKHIAEALGVHSQNIYRAKNQPPKKGYITVDRLFKLREFFRTQERSDLVECIIAHMRLRNVHSVQPPYAGVLPSAAEMDGGELWQFAMDEPLELNVRSYRSRMMEVIENPNARLVYFVRSRRIATRLLNVLSAVTEQRATNLVVVGTSAVAVSPDYLVWHKAGETDGEAMMFPSDAGSDVRSCEQIVRLPDVLLKDTRSVLEEAGLLDAYGRIIRQPSGTYGGGDIPTFDIHGVL